LYETFIDRSTHLGDVFAEVGNAGFSKKMVSQTMDQEVFVIKTFSLLVVPVLLQRDNIVENFLFAL
jgi:hypothetical protein